MEGKCVEGFLHMEEERCGGKGRLFDPINILHDIIEYWSHHGGFK